MSSRIFKFDYLLLILFFLVFFCYFYNLDKGIILDSEFFPWDSYHYNEIALEFINKNGKNTFMYPFNERILFPFIVAFLSKMLNLNILWASFILNILSTFLITLIIFISLNKFKVSVFSRFFVVSIFLISFVMPLRYSIYYPNNNYAFDILIISLIICLTYLQIEKRSKVLFFISIFISIVATTERGVVVITIYLLPLITLFILKKKNYLERQSKEQIFNFFIYFLFSALTWISIKSFGFKGAGDYNMLVEIISSFHFQSNIFEFIYKYYYSLGIFFFLILIYIFLNLKFFKFKNIKTLKIKNLFVFTLICNSIIFSTIGGRGDVDKHLLWFVIPYIVFSGIIFDKLIKIKKFKRIILPVFIIAIIGSRPFVPAWPPLAFSNIFVEKNHVNTNFLDKLYYGPEFLKQFRNKMASYDLGNDKVYKNVYIDEDKNFSQKIEIPDGQYFAYAKHRNYIHAYKYRLNDIPFPLGYIHNHRNALIDHPYHGHRIIRFLYVSQWILLQIIVIFYLRSISLFRIFK